HTDVMRVVLARAARSARRTTHFDLDFPRAPQLEPYWCHKHRRTCRPVDRAEHFLRRYALDTLARIQQFPRLRRPASDAAVLAGALRHATEAVRPGAPVLIVVNDRRDLYPEILARAGLRLEERLRRHVNRRTGRRAGEFFEDVLVARLA